MCNAFDQSQVLEEEEYHRRKEYYNSTGQRHYYFMNVGNGEVIDACRKVRQREAAGGLIKHLKWYTLHPAAVHCNVAVDRVLL